MTNVFPTKDEVGMKLTGDKESAGHHQHAQHADGLEHIERCIVEDALLVQQRHYDSCHHHRSQEVEDALP